MRDLNIRPSASARWLNCPGNPRIQTIADNLPQEPEADYAAEGTLAHAYLEFCLTGLYDSDEFDNLPEDDKKLISDVADNIIWYAETCGYKIETEKEYSVTVPLVDGRKVTIYGHIDVLLSSYNALIVLDYKHGAGKHVSVIGNPQTTLYLLCAAEGRAKEGHPEPKNMAMGIIQPRGVGDGWRMVNVQYGDLAKFYDRICDAVQAAYEPTVEYNPGPHCWKCPGQRGLCPAILSKAVDCIVQTPPGDVFEPAHAAVKEAKKKGENPAEARKVSIEGIFETLFGGVLPWALLDVADDTRTFIKEFTAYADTWLKAGRAIPGWCLESSPGRRSWGTPAKVAQDLADLLGGSKTQYERTTTTPITLTEAERIAKKKGKSIDDLVKKPTVQKRVKSDKLNPQGFSAVE